MNRIVICKFFSYLTIIVTLCVNFNNAQQLQALDDLDDVPVDPKCYQNMIKANPTLRDRFSDDLLRQHCRKSEIWKKHSTDGLGKSTKPLLTPAQLDWATNIWNCKDIRCMCEMFDFCKQFLKSVEAMTNFTNPSSFKVPNIGGIGSGKNSGALPGLGNLKLGGGRRRRRRQDQLLLNDVLRDKVGKANRKEIRAMTNGERNRFFRALNRLKSEKIDSMSKYDILIVYHTPEYSPAAHFDAAFLPFHRELLKSLEMALRTVDPDTSLAYWDTTLDEGLPDPKDSILWSDAFLGNGQGDVTSGPFANWSSIPDTRFKPLSQNLRIVRGLGTSPFGSLMKDKDIDTLLNKRTFRDFVYCVDPFTELIHGATHMWVGGHMLELRISPNDPSFFIFHTFVDYIWEQWRQQKQTRQQRESDYVANKDACNQFSFADAAMKPFSIKVSDGLSNIYTDQLYVYEPRPACSPQNPTCSSEYLFCDVRRYKCLSKVKLNGNCNGFDGTDICYQSRCSGGRCIPGGEAQATLPPPLPLESPTPNRPPLFTVGPTAPVAVTSGQLPQVQTDGRKSFFTVAPPSVIDTAVKPTIAVPPVGPAPIVTLMPPVIEKIDPPGGGGGSSVTELPSRPFTGSRFSASSDTVWTPITVLSVSGQAAQPYPDAKIVSHDADHGTQYFGRTADQSQVPYYSGAAYAQITNPYFVNGPVEATVEVFDAANKKCISMCLNERLIYAPCQPKVRLYHADASKSDNVPYTPNINLAKYLNWNNSKRNPDKFLFLCSPVSLPSQGRTFVLPPPTVPPSVVVTRSLPEPPEAPATRPPDVTEVPATSESSLKFVGRDKNSKPSGNNDGDEVIVRIITVNDEKSSRRNGGCQNAHKCCSIWAEVGECKRNPWMQDSCEKDCGVCSSGMADVSNDNSCADNHPSCKSWADDAQCTKNADWMEENCKKSCNVCKRTIQELKVLCGGSPKSGKECQNFNEKCSDWAKTDECQRNPWWMKENCPMACKLC